MQIINLYMHLKRELKDWLTIFNPDNLNLNMHLKRELKDLKTRSVGLSILAGIVHASKKRIESLETPRRQ